MSFGPVVDTVYSWRKLVCCSWRRLSVIMDCRIRLATPDDEPLLWEMLYLALFVPPGSPPLPRDVVQSPALARYVRRWGRDHDLGAVALHPTQGEPMGAAWLRLWAPDERGYGYCDAETPELSMAVLPAYRGQGVGGRLLDYLLRAADERHRAVSLSVSADNPALRLYRRFGFVVVGQCGQSLTMKRMGQVPHRIGAEPSIAADRGRLTVFSESKGHAAAPAAELCRSAAAREPGSAGVRVRE
jgi:ribosomal protein S18 acetylase RimI-like enzyme